MKVAISTPTEAEYNELMEYLESKGYTWASGNPPTQSKNWGIYEDKTQIAVGKEYKEITYCVSHKEVIPYAELKANTFKIEIQL